MLQTANLFPYLIKTRLADESLINSWFLTNCISKSYELRRLLADIFATHFTGTLSDWCANSSVGQSDAIGFQKIIILPIFKSDVDITALFEIVILSIFHLRHWSIARHFALTKNWSFWLQVGQFIAWRIGNNHTPIRPTYCSKRI